MPQPQWWIRKLEIMKLRQNRHAIEDTSERHMRQAHVQRSNVVEKKAW